MTEVMEQNQFTDEDVILKLLEENNGSLSIEKMAPLFSRDKRSPKDKYFNHCIVALEKAGCIFMKDKRKVIWAITDEGTKRLNPEISSEKTETVKEEVPMMANEGDQNNHY